MSDTTLSFDASASFRNNLMGRNLPSYNVEGAYSSPSGNVNYEISPLRDSQVIDSPNNLIGTTNQANELYPLNQWGPEGGFTNIISTDGAELPVDSNHGEYGLDDADIDLVNEFYIDIAYVKNVYGPEGGYKDLFIVTDLIPNTSFFLPYADNQGTPITFTPSQYTSLQILLDNNPQGSNGALSQDSALARRAAEALKEEFQYRIEWETQQLVSSVFQLDQLQDPFEASLVATGQQPLIGKNWKITVPENPVLAAVSFANRITGTYFPVSPIPGDYFDETNQVLSPQTENALNVTNNLTGGFLGPILNKYRNPSEVFVANTGYGQKSVLFKSLDYNIYRPKYDKGLLLGVTSQINNLLGNNTTQGGGYYVGSDQAEPSTINMPPNEIPVDRFGKQQPSPVYGPNELANLYEGNIDKIKFGLAGKAFTNQGGITGQFTWVSPKYKDNLGFKVKPGGDPAQLDQEFNAVKYEFNDDTESTGFEFKGGSILDNTQRLVESADNITSAKRLQHVGNAINQVSKVFNDGYKELTKGSQVIAYYDSVTDSETISIAGMEIGREYCRVFQKDTPYLTYGDLQKSDGITKSGRRFEYSVLDNTYNLNIAPLRLPDSTNIFDGKVKKYMFSLENLAWRTSSEPGFTYDDLPICERGPNGGRVMWFPPYDLSFSETSSARWSETPFIGRPEPIFTYSNTKRTGNLSWNIVVDSPAAMNTIIEKQLANMSPAQVDSIMDSFFAGCVKYDLYDLAIKFNQIPVNELFTYQELLQNPRLTDEEKFGILTEIPRNPTIISDGGNTIEVNANGGGSGTNTNGSGGFDDTTTTTDSITTESVNKAMKEFIGYGFYFDNDYPIGQTSTLTSLSTDFKYWYDIYLGRRPTYATQAPANVVVNTTTYSKEGIPNFFNDVVIGNFEKIQSVFLQQKLKEALVDLEGTVTLELRGGASAPATTGYNVNLSKRRNSVVTNWLLKQTVGDKTLKVWKDLGKFKLVFTPLGETAVIPKSPQDQQLDEDGNVIGDPAVTNIVLDGPVNCTVDIKDKSSNSVTSRAQWYSIPAMACRRVAISKIKIENTKELKWACKPDGGGCIQSKDGIFESKEQCENAPIDQGGCKKPEPINKWKCNTGGVGCIEVNDGSGIYAEKKLCEDACPNNTTRYNCVSGKCVPADASGQYANEQECIDDGCGTPPPTTPDPPRPTPTIQKEIKEGISKKILRNLFSECDYFELIKEENPFVYNTLKEKIKYFNPAFHSMTPEGLNARLTILNQCVRPGQTIPIIGPDGKPKFNDAKNTAFGAPPVLVLRVGDFYHTKIIPNQLAITYEPLLWDINPEGIGVQPMLAKVTLGFEFVGGHGLAGPVYQLQNALSFNYYANTEIYDERAIPTESVRERDKKVVGAILDRQGLGTTSNPAPINNLPVPERGGSTIGNILTTETFADGSIQTGTTEFKGIFNTLSEKTNGYFSTVVNNLKSVYRTTNYPILQLTILQRDFTQGKLDEFNVNPPTVPIFGKPSNIEDNISKVVKECIKDVDDAINPIIKAISESTSNFSNASVRDVKNSMRKLITDRGNELPNDVTTPLNTLVAYQEDYVQVFRKLDVILKNVDGYKLDTGKYKVYNLSGVPNINAYQSMQENYKNKIGTTLNEYAIVLSGNSIIDPLVIRNDKLSFSTKQLNMNGSPDGTKRFYMVMSQIFTNEDKYNRFVDSLLTPKVKENSDLVTLIQNECKLLKDLYTLEYQYEEKIFTDYENSEVYKKFTSFKIEEFDSTMKYSTEKNNDYNFNEKLLKNLYSDLNIEKKKNTFNGKITFN